MDFETQTENYSGRESKFKWFLNTRFKNVYRFGFKDEFKILLYSSIPLILNQLSQTFLPIISLFFCGHIGSNELAAVTIANTFINIGSFSVLVGLCSACDTLLPQLYGGVDKKKVGLVLQKGLIISFLSCFPTSGILLNVKNLMKLFVQEKIVINLADQYIITYLPAIIYSCRSPKICSIPSIIKFNKIKIFLEHFLNITLKNIFYPILFINILANILNVFFHYLFVFQLQYSVIGAAASVVLSNFLILAFVLIYITYTKMYKLTWPGWTRECLCDWSDYLKLAIPGFAMLFFGLANFEIGVIASGKLGKVGISIMSIGIQTTYIAFMIPLGIATSANIRIGQLLGENLGNLAQNSCKVAYTLGSIASLVTCFFICLTSGLIPYAFTDENEIIPNATILLQFLAFAHIMDALQGIGGGVLKAMGAQLYGFIMVLISLYIIGIPVGITLMLKTQYKVLGYWIGYLIGASVLIILQVLFILKIDWNEKAQQAYNQSLILNVRRLSQATEFFQSGQSEITFKTPLLKNNKQKFKKALLKKIPSFLIILIIFVMLFLARIYLIKEEKQIQKSLPDNLIMPNTTYHKDKFWYKG